MAVLQLQWQWWINWGGEAAELTYQLHIGSPVLPGLQGLRSALIPLSLHSPTDPRQGPRDTRPGEHPPKLFSETQALKTGVVPRCLADAPIYYPARKACWVVWSWGASKSKLGGSVGCSDFSEVCLERTSPPFRRPSESFTGNLGVRIIWGGSEKGTSLSWSLFLVSDKDSCLLLSHPFSGPHHDRLVLPVLQSHFISIQ